MTLFKHLKVINFYIKNCVIMTFTCVRFIFLRQNFLNNTFMTLVWKITKKMLIIIILAN